MKLSEVLCKHHIGRMIRSLWYIQGKKKINDLNTEAILKSRGIEIEDAKNVLEIKRKKTCVKSLTSLQNPENKPCLLYNDNNLLVEGIPQAQLITKTIIFKNELPKSIEALTNDLSDHTNELVKRIIKTSVIFDAYQQLLPKIKDPKRPAFVFPRQMGITDVRKISNLSKKFIQLCDCLSGPEIANCRYIVDNALFSFPFEKNSELFKFSLTMDIILMSNNPLRPAKEFLEVDESQALPSIDPLHYSIGLNKSIINFESLYPLISNYNKKNIHTIFIFYDHTQVKNETELEVTETQVFARAILKAFTAASSFARLKYGPEIENLPEPVTVQCIHSDGKAFYFSVYQLNTLNIEEETDVKNYCWTLPKLDLYTTAGYVDGIPTIDGYNPEVFKRILAFYKNN